MKVTCDTCNGEFEPKQDMLKETYLGAMITETYFNCPICSKKYLVCINTPRARKLMTDFQKCAASGNNIKAEQLRKELKVEMDRSNGKSAY